MRLANAMVKRYLTCSLVSLAEGVDQPLPITALGEGVDGRRQANQQPLVLLHGQEVLGDPVGDDVAPQLQGQLDLGPHPGGPVGDLHGQVLIGQGLQLGRDVPGGRSRLPRRPRLARPGHRGMGDHTLSQALGLQRSSARQAGSTPGGPRG